MTSEESVSLVYDPVTGMRVRVGSTEVADLVSCTVYWDTDQVFATITVTNPSLRLNNLDPGLDLSWILDPTRTPRE